MNNEGVFINETQCIPFSKTNLPIQSFAFVEEHYWEVAIDKPESSEKVRFHPEELVVNVINYYAKPGDRFNKQKLKSDVVFLLFKPFQYAQFSKQVVPWESGLLRRMCSEHPAGAKVSLFEKPVAGNPSVRGSSLLSRFSRQSAGDSIKQDREKTILVKGESFKAKWEDAKIVNGAVTFCHKVPGYNPLLHIQIRNAALREEFDLLKPYIIKRLGKKTFTVNLNIELDDDGYMFATADSPDIEKIDTSFFEVIRTSIVRSHLKKPVNKATSQKLLFSAEEILEADALLLNRVLTLQEIIAMVTEEDTCRNALQINFLAESHQEHVMPVKVSLNPNFGFMFLLSTKTSHNFIWELLDSNATYVWKFDALIKPEVAFGIIEKEINSIYAQGRNNYKRERRGFPPDKGFRFDFVVHNEIVNAQEGFEFWKEELTKLVGS